MTHQERLQESPCRLMIHRSGQEFVAPSAWALQRMLFTKTYEKDRQVSRPRLSFGESARDCLMSSSKGESHVKLGR